MEKKDFFLKRDIKNPKLEEYMDRMKEDSSLDNMKAVLTESAKSRFAVPVYADDEKISFNVMKDSKNRMFMVIYSDTDRMYESTSKDQKAVEAGFEDIISVAIDENLNVDGVIVDPGTKDIVFGKEMLRTIASDMGNAENVLKVGEPNAYPGNMLPEIEKYCKEEQKIEEAYVRLFVNKETGLTGWFFVLKTEGSEDEKKYVRESFEKHMKPYLDGLPAMTLDYENEASIPAVKGVRPVYTRK